MTDKESKIRRLIIQALATDSTLVERLVLKGGNLLSLVYQLGNRTSQDIDYSIDGEFSRVEIKDIEAKIRKCIDSTLYVAGYKSFDFKFEEKPHTSVSNFLQSFWGGYRISFKVISTEDYSRLSGELDKIRKQSIPLGKQATAPIEIEISKFEQINAAKSSEIDGFIVKVYTPEMIVAEKLRAICQQLPEYKEIVGSVTNKPRPRDFYDIYIVISHWKIDFSTQVNFDLLKDIFSAKKVPLEFLCKIENSKDFHFQGYGALKASVPANVLLEKFEFYFDFVLNECKKLEPFWKK